jgi:Na+/H+ antiporter NhaD/arsenite permease-like protein
MTLTFCFSAFLNNTPIVAALIPVTRDWCRLRGFSPSAFLIPLSFSCILGGLLTVIGTSTNLVVNGN